MERHRNTIGTSNGWLIWMLATVWSVAIAALVAWIMSIRYSTKFFYEVEQTREVVNRHAKSLNAQYEG